ncbi:MAG: ABC transporter permease [Opitutaceae bacterium]
MTSAARIQGGGWRRLRALIRKETRQMSRDPATMLVGILLPMILLLVFGYGLSLDVKHVPVAIVLEDPSPEASELAASFQLSPYFEAQLVTSMPLATRLMLDREVDGIVRIRGDFARRIQLRDTPEAQVIVNGADANRARTIQSYARGAIAQWTARQVDGGFIGQGAGPVVVRSRMWFNEASESRHFLVPGLIVLVMTLIGAFLTALVVAREWERGTFEALFVTPVRSHEILIGKTVPYFVLGMVGFALCLLTARFLFHVPLRGSLLILTGGSMLYLLAALGIGLVISAVARNQFVASQLAAVVSFLPAMMLSGFLFDIRSMPQVLQTFTFILPARYYVSFVQTLFLAGNVPSIIATSTIVLALMAAALLFAAQAKTRKKLD